jgi:RecB family exonuclease
MVRRVFIGWDAPALPAAAAELVNRYQSDNALDLARVLVVAPGQRAGRRLVELLVDAAARQGLVLTPPDVITESALPERLYEQQKPLAPPLIRRLAWTKAVQELKCNPGHALVPHPAQEADYFRWVRLGEMLGRIQVELAAAGHDVESVVREAEALPGFADQARWAAVRAAQDAYHATLAELGLGDENTARLAAVQKQEVNCDFDIILLGTVDLNAVSVKMLAQVADRVTTFVVAPQAEASRFDEFGRLDTGAWQAAPVPIRDDQVLYADDPAGQASAAIEWLAGLDGHFANEDVVIGIPDPAVVPPLRRQLAAAGVRVRWVEGRTLANTAPYRLLAAVAEHATGRRYEAFAALVRHPDVAAWLAADGTPIDLTALDNFYRENLPTRVRETNLPAIPAVRPVFERIGKWLKAAAGARPLRDWADTFTGVLGTVYAGRDALDLSREADRVLHAALERMLDALDALRHVPPGLDRSFAASDAFTVAFEGIAKETVPPAADPGAVELLGWLELPLDDAPAVLVTTFNDGHVPTAAGADPFVPDALRARLGLEHNARRYARDAYAATVLARSKQRFACVVARRNANKDLLAPSRLLFSGPDAEVIARADHWVRGSGAGTSFAPLAPDRPSPFAVPRPVRGARRHGPFDVTEFRTYLACKYRYYLRHVRKLSALSDDSRELDGGAFGKLLHEVLQAWGADPEWRDCGDAGLLADHLTRRLMLLAGERFGDGWPAVRLQLAQAARRLKGFAQCQAGLIADGWRITYTESSRRILKTDFAVGAGQTVTLRGRIDRIDYHAGRNIVRVLDYKAADVAVAPEKTHRKQDRWIDLQLPLYRHLWRNAVSKEQAPEDAAVELAYFQIPRAWGAVEVAVASNWDDAVLAAADETARQVIAGILAEEFWPPITPAPDYFEDYAAICLDGRQAPPVTDEDDDDA